MKVTFTLIPTIEEQRSAGDRDIIDPAGVKIPSLPMPLWRGLNYNVPDDVIGWVHRLWLEGGRLLGEADLVILEPAYGGNVQALDEGVVRDFDLHSAGLSWVPANMKRVR